MNTRGLRGMLAPTYQELHDGNNVPSATSLTCATHSSSAAEVGSMHPRPRSRAYRMQSAIHSTCCSMLGSMLVSTEGLPGPVMVNRLGKSAIATPRYVRGPSVHFSSRLLPALPRMSMLRSAP